MRYVITAVTAVRTQNAALPILTGIAVVLVHLMRYVITAVRTPSEVLLTLAVIAKDACVLHTLYQSIGVPVSFWYNPVDPSGIHLLKFEDVVNKVFIAVVMVNDEYAV